MQIEYTKGNPIGAKYSRYKVPVAAAAAGVPAIDGIWQEIKDEKGLQQDCKSVSYTHLTLQTILLV